MMRNRALPVFLVFVAMGFGDVVGPMVSLAKDAFQLSNFMAQLLPSAGLIMFGVLSVPMGILQDRKGKKLVLMAGLLIALIGLLIPMFAGMYGPKPEILAVAIDVDRQPGGEKPVGPAGKFLCAGETENTATITIIPDKKETDKEAKKEADKIIPLARDVAVQIDGKAAKLSDLKANDHLIVKFDVTKFFVLLGSILLLGTGATMLQVVGNPLIRDVSPEGEYSRNLSLAQAIKAIGSSMGFLLPPLAVMAFGLDWPMLFPIYSAIIVITLLMNAPLQIHETRDPNAKPATFGSCFALLLGNSFIMMMVLGIFLYVGAEICFSAQVPVLLKDKFGIEGFGLWVGWSLFFLPILVGRFTGAAVLKTMSAQKFFILTTLFATVGIICVLTGIEALAFVGIVMAGLGFANIFPLIFSITIDHMPQRSNEISGLMISAIIGGAVLPPIMGIVADATKSVQWSFLVPLAALAYICVLAVRNLKAPSQQVRRPEPVGTKS
jgi:MFS transporter, FHS family, L-fucose permease